MSLSERERAHMAREMEANRTKQQGRGSIRIMDLVQPLMA
jgi:hypothetical protein